MVGATRRGSGGVEGLVFVRLMGLMWGGAAAAQDGGVTVAVPEINVQAWRMPVDAEATLWTDDASGAPDHYVEGRVAVNYLNDPLVYRYSLNGGPQRDLNVVSDVWAADVIAAYSFKNVRLGLDVPVLMNVSGDGVPGGAGLGDVALDVKGVILDREGSGAPVGVALVARGALPTSTVEGSAVGASGFAWELAGVVDHRLGPVLLAGNLGTRGRPAAELGGTDWRGQAFFRLGAGWYIVEDAGVSVDLVGALGYGNPIFEPASTPMEGLLGGFGRLGEWAVLRGGLGTALTSGVSAPDFRLIAALGYEPPKVRDRDLDGVSDRDDACPEEPEDLDRWKDEDGCPDPSAAVHVIVEDHLGDIVYNAALSLETPTGPLIGSGDGTYTLHPGDYPVQVNVPRYAEHIGVVAVPSASPVEHRVRLTPLFGEVRVEVLGDEGERITGFAQVEGALSARISGGVARLEADPGDRSVIVRADGYQPVTAPVHVDAGVLAELRVQLVKAKARVVADRIEILDKVYFDVGKSTIKAASLPLLDEVATVLIENPRLLKVSVDGHTDDQGSARVNTRLSQQRADAVRAYLIGRGVEAERLVAVGFGPARPLDPARTPAAREINRRVEFVIVEQRLDAE